MLLVTKTHHERDETKVPDRLSLQDIGQVETNLSINTFILTMWRCMTFVAICDNSVFPSFTHIPVPSMLWRCLVGRQEGHPVCKKQSGGVLAWLSFWSEVQTCIRLSWCHSYSLSLALVKSRLVLPFWYRLTRVVPDKWPLNRRVLLTFHYYSEMAKHYQIFPLFSQYFHFLHDTSRLALLSRGNVVGFINKVTQHQAWLVLGILPWYANSHPGRLNLLLYAWPEMSSYCCVQHTDHWTHDVYKWHSIEVLADFELFMYVRDVLNVMFDLSLVGSESP